MAYCRGQCYDDAAKMAGIWNGVAAQMCAEEARAVYSHCYGHALNLAASDTVKKNKILHDVLNTVFEITKLLKFSLKQNALFDKLQHEIAPGIPGFLTLCPTRWTIWASPLRSVLDRLPHASNFVGKGARFCHRFKDMSTSNLCWCYNEEVYFSVWVSVGRKGSAAQW